MQKTSKSRAILYALSPVIVFILLFAGLQGAIIVYDIPSWLIATPTDTVKYLISHFGEIMPNLWVTIKEILIGYVIGCLFGITMAFVFTNSKFMARAVNPYVIFLIVTPQIIMVPLLMLWLGFGIQVRIIAVALSSFPINMLSTMTGVSNVSIERYELMRSLRATALQTFTKVLVPSALPNVFTGLRLATIFATTSAVSAELISGNQGIGPQIAYFTEFMQVAGAFAYIYIMAAVCVIFYSVMSFLENRVIKSRK